MSLSVIRRNDGAFLIEMMIALGIFAVISLATTTLVTNSSLGTRSNNLGAQFNQDTSLVQGLLNNTTSCTAGFRGTDLTPILTSTNYGTPETLTTIPTNGSPLITGNITTPGLEYTQVQINKVLEKVSSTSYLLNIHLEAQKIGNAGTVLPGNNHYAKDMPLCVTLNPDLVTIKGCGPTACAGPTITGIAVGTIHTCVVTDTGVKCWGSDVTNFEGNHDPVPGSVPPVYNTANFDTLGNNSAAPTFSFAPLSVSALPANSVLTFPNFSPTSSPSYREIQAGGTHTCVQTPSGGMECWGNLSSGQLGSGPTGLMNVPSGADPSSVFLPAIPIVDFFTGTDTSCAVMNNGLIYCWGCNWDGQLGRGATPFGAPGCGGGQNFEGANLNTPMPVLDAVTRSPVTGAQMVGGGMGFFCAILNGGTKLDCWGECDDSVDMNQTPRGSVPLCGDDPTPGDNTGDSYAYDRTSYFTSLGVTQFLSVVGGTGHGCALTLPGNTLYCWGENTYGQLGTGGTGWTSFPTTAAATGVTSVSAGGFTTCAMIGGVLNCWGDNTYGQIGQGAGVLGGQYDSPTPVQGLPAGNVTAYSVGRYAVCAVMDMSSVYCWGANGYYLDFTILPNPQPAGYPSGPWTQPFYNLGNSTSAPTGAPTLVNGL